MNLPPDIIDIHTHHADRYRSAVVNVSPAEAAALVAQLGEDARISTGIHPWESDHVTDSDLDRLAAAARLPMTVAIGETGLDAMRGAPLDRQTDLFAGHVTLSEELSKPLVIHLVKNLDTLLALRRSLSPSQPWIVHGFRGKPQQARSLVDAGCHISLGARFNPDTARLIPADRLLAETDESATDIDSVIAAIAAARNTDPTTLRHIIRANLARL